MDENEDVEVQQIQGEGGFAKDDQRTKRKDRRDEIGAGESQDQQAEERREQAAMHEDVRSPASGTGVEEDAQQRREP